MATDPVERVRSEVRETPFSANLRQQLHALAQLEPSVTSPILSVYVDWRPEGESPGVRPGRRAIEDRLSGVRRALHDAGHDTRELDADIQRVLEFLEDGIDPAVHGIFILTRSSTDLFETVLLAIPLETDAVYAPAPALRQLAGVIEDYPRFAVLHADQHDAQLFVVSRASPQSAVALESNDYPRKNQQGGWSQRRYQNRQEERIQHFARAVAEEVRRVMSDEELTMLVLSVGEVFGSALDDELHQSVKSLIVGDFSMSSGSNESEIIEKAQDVALQAERNREAEHIMRLEDAIGSGNQGAGGAEEVIKALANGQVMTLLMASDFEGSGWADYQLNLYGVGDVPSSHPAGGDTGNLIAVDLGEELVRLGLATGAEIEIAPAIEAARLHKHGGVGALLRF